MVRVVLGTIKALRTAPSKQQGVVTGVILARGRAIPHKSDDSFIASHSGSKAQSRR